MSLKDLNAKLQAIKSEAGSSGEAFKKKGFLKEKIRNGTIAAAAKVASARVAENGPDVSPVEIIKPTNNPLSKVTKEMRRLADRLKESDREKGVEILRDAMTATLGVWNMHTKSYDQVPDHKMRLAAYQLLLLYDEGPPVQRQLILTGDLNGMDDALEQIKASPALAALLGQLIGGKVLEP